MTDDSAVMTESPKRRSKAKPRYESPYGPRKPLAHLGLLDMRAISERLGVSYSQVAKWRQRGMLPPADRVCGVFLWSPSVVEEFAAQLAPISTRPRSKEVAE